MRHNRRILDALAPILLKAWAGLMALLPYSATRAVGNAIGSLSYLLRTRSARTTEVNLRYCFPAMRDEKRKALAQQSLKHTGRLVAEAGITFNWSEEKLKDLIKGVDGFAPLQRSLDEHRGILVLVPHFGNWELFALYFGRYGFMALYDPPKIESIDQLIRESRERTGATLLPIDAQGVRGVLQALKRGKPVSILPDQVPARSAGVYAPFFNRPAMTMTFAHRLIQSTKPLVVLGSCTRGDDGFRISFHEVDEAIQSEDVETSVAAMNQAIEKLVQKNPEQYQWEYKRFKKPPAGTADPYK
jgi:KDO2-lipid IV(A) lauroyltransferase